MSLLLLLGRVDPTSEPSIIEINSDSYIVDEIEHGMKRPSTARFRPASALFDAEPLAARRRVKYTLGGTVIFVGRILPVTRRLDSNRDEVEYMAADVMEYLASNPILMENEWYNRSRDVNIYPYPTDASIRTIIETEFNAIVGTGKAIGALDWTEVPTDTQNLVILNLQTKGKTWLGLLEVIAAEVPTLSWWYDPSTTDGSNSEGGTLRFYDISKTTGTFNEAIYPQRDGLETYGVPTVESIEISIDISQSYDKLTLHGWGDMEEVEEQATPGWDYTKDGVFTSHYAPQILRDSPTLPGRVEQFSADSGGGTWSAVSDTSYLNPYFATSQRQPNRDAYRKWKVSREIVDLRLSKDDSVSPARYVSAERSMWVYTLQYGWSVGRIAFDIDGGYYVGTVTNGTKFVIFTNGIQDDFGLMRPEPQLYPNYPAEPLPKIEIGTPAAFERNYFTLQNARVFRTNYQFDGVSPSATDYLHYANLVGVRCYCYWGTGSIPSNSDLWLMYTAREELQVVLENTSLGYSKHLELWDQRFFKYTNIAGTVIRDDTAMLEDYAAAIFALASRKRVYGTITTITAPEDGLTAHPMGTFVRIRNWQTDGGTYDLPVMVQSIKMTDLRDQHKLVVGFDTATTFRSLDITTKFRQYFEANQVNGTSGTTGNGDSVGDGWGQGGGNGGDNTGGGGNSPGGGSGDGWTGGWPSCCQTTTEDPETSGSGGSVIIPP